MSYIGNITFKENNFPYMQDFHFMSGIPTGVKFEAEYIDKEKKRIKLTGKGYGALNGDHKDYGNGSIFVFKKDIEGLKEIK